jgi:hypothetical protein
MTATKRRAEKKNQENHRKGSRLFVEAGKKKVKKRGLRRSLNAEARKTKFSIQDFSL